MEHAERLAQAEKAANSTTATQGDLYTTEERLHTRIDRLTDAMALLAAAIHDGGHAKASTKAMLAKIAGKGSIIVEYLHTKRGMAKPAGYQMSPSGQKATNHHLTPTHDAP